MSKKDFLELSAEQDEDTGSIQYTVHLNGVLREPHYYRYVLEAALGAISGDEFLFIINSSDGLVEGMHSLLQAITITEANTRALVVCSAVGVAAVVATACDVTVLSDDSYIQFKPFCLVGHDIGKEIDRNIQTTLLKRHARLLTDEEIEGIVEGGSLILQENDIESRVTGCGIGNN